MSQIESAQFTSPGVATTETPFTAPFPIMGRPALGTGDLTVRLRKTESDPITAYVELLQGSAVIATEVVTPTTSYADYSLGLTADDIRHLTVGQCNLSDISVRVRFPQSIQTTCCENPIPDTLYASVSIPCLEGYSGDLVLTYGDWTIWPEPHIGWRGEGFGTCSGNDFAIGLIVYCAEITNRFHSYIMVRRISNPTKEYVDGHEGFSSETCSPFRLSLHGAFDGQGPVPSCCAQFDQYSFSVSDTPP